MAIDPQSLGQLEKDATPFVTKNHQAYLSQALECIRETQDPVEALRLLEKMFSSPFAIRKNMKGALNDVGKWLEKRLDKEPNVSADRIALELGWLRRLATVVEAEATKEQKNKVIGSKIAFGEKLESIAKKRTAKATMVKS